MADYKSLESNQLGIADRMIDWVRVVDKTTSFCMSTKRCRKI